MTIRASLSFSVSPEQLACRLSFPIRSTSVGIRLAPCILLIASAAAEGSMPTAVT
jgi:hypothetical protein